MTFEIQWTGHQGAAMTHRDTSAEAIRFAIEMLGKDFTDVVIVDLANGGKTYTPAEFARLYKDANQQRGGNGHTVALPSTSPQPTALAAPTR